MTYTMPLPQQTPGSFTSTQEMHEKCKCLWPVTTVVCDCVLDARLGSRLVVRGYTPRISSSTVSTNMLSAANINDLEAPLSEGVMNNNSKAERSSRGRDMLLGVCRFINCMTAAACISCICGLCMAITVGPAFTVSC